MSQIGKIGIVGAGNMGSGIAQKFAQEGINVVLVDVEEDFVKRGLANIRRLLDEGVERRLFQPEDVELILARICGTTDLAALADADLVIEAVYEDRDVKRRLFRELDGICGEKTILATNTSSFYVREFAEATSRPEKVIGLHYFYHPAKNRLLEVVPHEKTGASTVGLSLLAAKLHGKTAIVVKDAPGFAVNRFFVPFLNEAVRMLEEGLANIPTIEEGAKRAFGIGMGPFELMNVTGIPIAVHASATLGRELGPFYDTAPLMKATLESGQNWDLSGNIEENKIPAVTDRFYGVTLGVAAALVDEGVASIEDTDRGAKIGLRWGQGPFEIINALGIERTCRLVQLVCDRYPDFRMPGLLDRQFTAKTPFVFSFVDLDIQGDIAYITINRPEAMNALNETVIGQLAWQFDRALACAGVRAVVFRGAGKAFVAGADIRYFVDKIKAGRIADIVAFTRKGQELFHRIEEADLLTIALLDGLSLGGGSELALACQAVVATEAGSFGFPETGIGIYPGLGGMFRLARRIGPELARYYVLTGAGLKARDARDLGIVTKLVGPAETAGAIAELIREGKGDGKLPRPIPERFTPWQILFSEENLALLLRGEIPARADEALAGRALKALSGKAPLALKLASEIIGKEVGLSVSEAIELELSRLPLIFGTEDALEGLSSLGGKRPAYRGR